MRSFRHWTPRYIMNRLAEMYYHRTCPDHPWLTREANQILASYLKESDIGLEFGSGRSTLWFAKRVKNITSVEHDECWHKKVSRYLEDNNVRNVDYHLIPKDTDDDQGDRSSYVRLMERFEAGSVDFVLVDGLYRDFCALKALSIISPGGMLIIDNANWFLPHNTHSPNSRSFQQGPKGETWTEVYESITQWRMIWTSSGVTDTALLFKPCE